MSRILSITACLVALCAATMSPAIVQAQSLTIGRGGVQYNSYGRGYYGGYGNGYRGDNYGRGHRARVYSSYGNGPYGYGSSSRFPSNRGNRAYYNGYGNYNYGQTYAPVYNPYGVQIYDAYGNSW